MYQVYTIQRIVINQEIKKRQIIKLFLKIN